MKKFVILFLFIINFTAFAKVDLLSTGIFITDTIGLSAKASISNSNLVVINAGLGRIFGDYLWAPKKEIIQGLKDKIYFGLGASFSKNQSIRATSYIDHHLEKTQLELFASGSLEVNINKQGGGVGLVAGIRYLF